MTLKYSKLIVDIRAEVNLILSRYPLPADIFSLKDAKKYEYLLTINKLRMVLRHYEKFDNEDVTFDGLQPIIDFYTERYHRVKNTEASAHADGASAAEHLSINVSQLIENYFQEDLLNGNKKLSSFELRFPLLRIDDALRVKLGKLKTHQWFIASDNSVVILEDCLERARTTGRFFTTYPDDNELLIDDSIFLKTHSLLVRDYYSNFFNSSDDEVERLRARLHEGLESNNYVIKSIFSEAAKYRLQENCCRDFLKDICHISSWKLLLQGISIDILKSNVFDRVQTIPELDVGDLGFAETEARLKLIEISELYRQELDLRQSEYNGLTLNGVGMGLPRSFKLKAVEEFQQFLQSGMSLNQFTQYINDNSLQEYLTAYEDKRLIWNSTLCHIVTLAKTWSPNAANDCLSCRQLKVSYQ